MTTHRILWGHNKERNTMSLPESVVGYGIIKKGDRSRNLHCSRSSQLLVASRPHLSTEAVLGVCVPNPVLGTAMWEVSLLDSQWDIPFLLWINSTYGFISYLSSATSSMGDIFKMKKAQLQNMLVPDFAKFDIQGAQDLWEDLKTTPLKPFADEFECASKQKGVRYHLDCYIQSQVELPSLDKGRYQLLSQDPILTKVRFIDKKETLL